MFLREARARIRLRGEGRRQSSRTARTALLPTTTMPNDAEGDLAVVLRRGD